MSKCNGQAGAINIDITDEMKSAGAEAICYFQESLDHFSLAVEVYKAMVSAIKL